MSKATKASTATPEMDFDPGFNNIGPWLNDKLQARGLNINSFCKRLNYAITAATIWRWCADKYRPYPETMKLVCDALSVMPCIAEDGSEYFEEVPWSEGLDQYTPKLRAWVAHYANGG